MKLFTSVSLPLWLAATLIGCASTSNQDAFTGSWNMVSDMRSESVDAVLLLERKDDGDLAGRWLSRGREMELFNIEIDGDRIEFDRNVPGAGQVHFEGVRSEAGLTGKWTGSFGEIPVAGRRSAQGVTGELAQAEEFDRGEFHDRPIVEQDGKTLLWADDEGWFDVTDAMIDPEEFQYGIGKDTIASIDEPVFVAYGDPQLEEAGVTANTMVLGIEIEGEARAYPVNVMDMHEVVNDNFAGNPYAVMW